MRRPFVLGLVGSLVVSLGGLAYVQHRSTRADDALQRARALVDVPFERAPELHDLEVGDALAALEEAESLGASDATLRHDLEALSHLKRGDLIFAEGSLTAARHADGWNVDRHVVAATIARSADNREVAREHVRAALAEQPDHARALLLEADLALDAREGRIAKRALEQLLEVGSRVPAIHNRLGLAHELVGDEEEARESFQRALTLDDAFVEAWVNLGRSLRAAGELDEAFVAFSAATEHAVGDGAAWLGRGLCALDSGRLEEAHTSLGRAAELSSLDPVVGLALADLSVAEGDLEVAANRYRAVLRERMDLAEAWVKLGNVLVRLNEPVDAVRAFEQAIVHEPSLAAAHNGLGAALVATGDPARARTSLERAAELAPNDPNPLLNLALLHERGGDARSAREAWSAALSRDPEHPIALARLGR